MSARFRGVHIPMKYVVYDIIGSQTGGSLVYWRCRRRRRVNIPTYVTFVVKGVATVGDTVVSALGKGNAV